MRIASNHIQSQDGQSKQQNGIHDSTLVQKRTEEWETKKMGGRTCVRLVRTGYAIAEVYDQYTQEYADDEKNTVKVKEKQLWA